VNEETYEQQLTQFIQATAQARPEFANTFYRWPILNEDTAQTQFDSHYIYHVAWALRKIRSLAPQVHVDFASSLSFCTALSAFCKTVFYDFRPADLHLDNLEPRQCDLSAPDFGIGEFASVSCMHVVEHIGLGRYGDKLDDSGDLKAIANLKKTVAPGGDLFFVVPCGAPSIHFNAHRVYSAESILDYFGTEFALQELYFITGHDHQAPLLNPPLDSLRQYAYGCGCFHFKRLA
jgi:hypothetical protein